MDHRDDKRRLKNGGIFGESTDGQQEGPAKQYAVPKAIRAVTAVALFGIPLVTGVAVLLGYGVYKACRGLTGRSS